MAVDKSELSVIIEQQGVSQTTMQQLAEAFGAPFEEAGEIITELYDRGEDGTLTLKQSALRVTDVNDKQGMATAREQRMVLKRVRTGVESKRKELKEDYLRAGQAIDKTARYIRDTIAPAEEYLEAQEKFAENIAKEQAARIKAERINQIVELGGNPDLFNLDMITDEMFSQVIVSLQADKDRREALEREQAEAEERERKAKEEEEKRIREENARLKAEAEAREAKEREEREAREAKEREEAAARQAEERRINTIVSDFMMLTYSITTIEMADHRLRALEDKASALAPEDRENSVVSGAIAKTKAIILEIKAAIQERERKKEEDRIALEEANRKAAEEEAARKAAAAPDREKLEQFAKSLNAIEYPVLSTEEAKKVLAEAQAKIQAIASDVQTKGATL